MVWFWSSRDAALVAPLFVLALPIIDTTLAILRRGGAWPARVPAGSQTSASSPAGTCAKESAGWAPPQNCAAHCRFRNSPEKQENSRHLLAGHKYCFLELVVACPQPRTAAEAAACEISHSRLNTYSIQAELLAESWSKAVNDWKKKHQLPARFDARPPSAIAPEPPEPKPDLTGVQQVPLDE